MKKKTKRIFEKIRNKRRILFLKPQVIILCFIMLISVIPIQYVFADANDQTSNVDIVRDLSLSYKLKGGSSFTDLLSPYTIADSTKIEKLNAKFSFALNDNVNQTTGEEQRTVKNGDYYYINLPDKVIISTPSDGVILGNAGRPLANYTFVHNPDSTWQIKVTFTDYVEDTSEFSIHGEFAFDFTLDLSSVSAGSSTIVSIPITSTTNIDINITKPVPPITMPTTLTKSVSSLNNQTRQLVWNVNISPNNGVFSGCVFKDTIDINNLELVSIKHGTVTLVEGTDYSFNNVTGEIIYTIPNGRDGTNYQNIIITTLVKRSTYANITPTIISNQANLSGGDSFVDINSNTATQTITPDWLSKSGTLLQGNKIQWTINANITTQLIYNAIVTDNFQADVKLDKTSVFVGSTNISVYDDSHTPSNSTEIYGIYTGNYDGTSKLQVYFARDQVNASSAKQTISFKTDVVAPGTLVVQDTIYNNTASLDCNYLTDGNGEGTLTPVNLDQVGVAVPNVFINKSHVTISDDDKRNGTITWTISAASNVTTYGKSVLVDTLPIDQDFIADEIYCGGVKIDETTGGALGITAEISPDGRTLTVTFNNNNALRTQKDLTVKTRIKTETYGTNINRDFTNSVICNLISDSTTDVIATKSDADAVRITNTVISKAATTYNENTTTMGQNPRMNFNIVVNSNLMQLNSVLINDNLNNLITKFKKAGESTYNTVAGVNWNYVPGTLKIVKSSGTLDSLDLSTIVSNSGYLNNQLAVDFGSGVTVNDKYTITFTAELDVSQNSIFKGNGTIVCSGNIADVTAVGLKTGTISTSPTENSPEIKNEVLGKSGVNLVAEQQAVWTINLNQHKVTLDNANVVDILAKGLTLDPTSIKLYKNVIGTDGNFISGSNADSLGTPVTFNYTYLLSTLPGMEGRYTLTVELPDKNTDYILRFSTDIDKSLLGTQITNTAIYSGQTLASENFNTSSVALSGTSGGGSINKANITINKYDHDTSANLSGTSFTLNWLRNGDPADPVFVRTLTSTTGSIVFRGLTRGEKYTITETLAPDGYVIDNPNPVEFNVTAGTGALSPLNFYDTQIKTGSWNPTAIKKLDGKDILHIFNFEILEGTTSLLTGSTKNVLPNGDYSVEFAMKVGIDPNNILNFTNNHYFADSDPTGTQYLVATKNFNMKEITGNLAGYSYDTTIHALVLKVYNVKGQSNLKMVIEDPNGTVLSDNSGNFKSDEIPTFLNTYKANGSIQLSAQKVLEGHGLAAGQFSFDLYEGSTLLETVQNKVGITSDNISYVGDIDFSVINYKLSDIGTKNYTIVEKDTKLQGYSYDTTVYNVEVQVTDNDTGILTSSITSIKKVVNGVTTDVTMVAFKNTYATSDTTTQISATKNLTGHSLEDHQFSFILNQVTAQGLLIKQISTTTNEGNNIIFPSISFNQNDIGESYYFQVSEVNDHIPGYIYDNSVYAVKVDVVDNNNGTITTVNTITKNSIVYPQVIFNNVYKLDGKVEITFTNDLTGKKIENEEFTFVLQQIDIKDNTIIGEEIIAKNSPSGQIYFPDLKYTEADTGKDFYYKLYQKNDNIAGYTYDMKVYYILVSVSDNGDGKLGITQKITASQGETKISFSTSYVPVVNSDEDILNKGTSIKTGDESELLLYIILLVISTSVLISYRFKKRENLISH